LVDASMPERPIITKTSVPSKDPEKTDPTQVATEMVPPGAVETVITSPTITPEPTATETLVPTVMMTETRVNELENTICSECLLPRAIQKDYEGVYDGITVKYSFAIDKTMLNHFPGTIIDFDLNVKDYPELPELIALNTLKLHYLGWKSDNLNSLISFDDYIEMVKNGGGQYTSFASIDDLSVPKAKRNEIKYVTVDPKKKVTYIQSMVPNILSLGNGFSIWPVQTMNGDFEFRHTGNIITGKNPVLNDYPEHALGRYWMLYYYTVALGHFIYPDNIDKIKKEGYPIYDRNPQILEEFNKIILDFFDNERGKITSPPYFHIDYRK